MARDDTEEYDLFLVNETPKAWGVLKEEPDDADFPKELIIWLPKSQVTMLTHSSREYAPVKIDIPDWLALDKGIS